LPVDRDATIARALSSLIRPDEAAVVPLKIDRQ
jgi:hypothetical protein